MLQPEVMKDVSLNIIKYRQLSKQNNDKSAQNLPKLLVGQPVSVKHTSATAQQLESRTCCRSGITPLIRHSSKAVHTIVIQYTNMIMRRPQTIQSHSTRVPHGQIQPQTTRTPHDPVQSAPAKQQHVLEECCTKSGRVSKPPRYLQYFATK